MSPAAPQLPPRPTALAHVLLRGAIHAGDLVVDATAGNGHDTLFLAEMVGASGRVLAFDVQSSAIAAARARVAACGWLERVEFRQLSHALLADHAAAAAVAAVMFNLGYLPGDARLVMTDTATTLKGLAAAATVLKPGGALTVVCYPGHDGGAAEAEAAEVWFAAKADEGWRVAKYGAFATRRPAPFLLMGTKGATAQP